MRGFFWSAYQGHQHIVFITDDGRVSQRRVIANAAERDIAFASVEERLDVRPRRRSGLRCRRALYAASACCAASFGATFHGSNSSIRLIGIGDALENVAQISFRRCPSISVWQR